MNTAVRKAVALRYDDEGSSAPTVVAKGRGYIADQIRQLAESSGIPIHRDNDLVELLAQVDLDREIPGELYAAVAEVLSWVYRANDEIRKEVFE